MTIKHMMAAAALTLAFAPLSSVFAEEAATDTATAEVEKAAEEAKPAIASGSETTTEKVKDDAGNSVKTIETTVNNPMLKN